MATYLKFLNSNPAALKPPSMNEGDFKDGLGPSQEFTQPLTELYKEAFTVPGGTAFWRGKLNFRTTKAKSLGRMAEMWDLSEEFSVRLRDMHTNM